MEEKVKAKERFKHSTDVPVGLANIPVGLESLDGDWRLIMKSLKIYTKSSLSRVYPVKSLIKSSFLKEYYLVLCKEELFSII